MNKLGKSFVHFFYIINRVWQVHKTNEVDISLTNLNDIYLYYGGQTLRSFVKEVTSIKLAKDRMNSAVRIQLSGVL